MNNKKIINILLFVLLIMSPINKSLMSWYGEPFFEKEMANGQKYTNNSLIFAHNELPLGTLVEFRYKNKVVVAKCTDRGNFDKYGREFDLSYKVAELLDFLDVGVDYIEWRIVYNNKAIIQLNKIKDVYVYNNNLSLLFKGENSENENKDENENTNSIMNSIENSIKNFITNFKFCFVTNW